MILLTPAKTAATGVGDRRRGSIQVTLLLVRVSGLVLAAAVAVAVHLRVDTLYPIQQTPIRDSRAIRPSLAKAKAVAVAASHRVRMVAILIETQLWHSSVRMSSGTSRESVAAESWH
jgi:hypothetical protein